MSRSRLAVIMVVTLVVLLAGIVAYAVAQPGQPGGQGGFGGGGAGQNPGMWMAMRGMMGGAAIAVSGDAVFVVRGSMIYKFDAGTLELLAQAEIPMPEMPAGMFGGGGAPGGPGRQQ